MEWVAVRNLRKGMEGDDVVVLQKALTGHGYTLNADGKFGPVTEKAVLDFQKSRGLVEDGIVGIKTLTQLGMVKAPDPTPVTPELRLSWGPSRASGPAVRVLPGPEKVLGFDISHYQPKVNWAELVKSGGKFLFAKATDGLGSKDSMFDTHRANAAKNGFIFGAYHFMRFEGKLSPKQEAELFLKATGGVRVGELPLVLDVEWDKRNSKYDDENMDEAAATEALEILERIEDAIKLTPIIYTSAPFFNGFGRPERFFRFHPWLPAYKTTGPKVPLPWSKWAFWQFTDQHALARAVTGDPHLDGNYFNGSLEELQTLTRQS